jgi:hypothetical protein
MAVASVTVVHTIAHERQSLRRARARAMHRAGRKEPSMRHMGILGVCGILLGVGGVPVASAEPVRITAGHLDVQGPIATLVLAGERGFTFSSTVHVLDGSFAPYLQCQLSCLPGSMCRSSQPGAASTFPERRRWGARRFRSAARPARTS